MNDETGAVVRDGWNGSEAGARDGIVKVVDVLLPPPGERTSGARTPAFSTCGFINVESGIKKCTSSSGNSLSDITLMFRASKNLFSTRGIGILLPGVLWVTGKGLFWLMNVSNKTADGVEFLNPSPNACENTLDAAS